MQRLILAPFLLLALSCGEGGEISLVSPVVSQEVCEYDTEIAFVGDSHSFVTGFVGQIAELYPPGMVVTVAIGGQNTRTWVPHANNLWQAANVDSLNPSYGVILLGSGDATFSPRTSVEVYKQNIQEMAAVWLEQGACEVILMSAPHVEPYFFDLDVQARLNGYSQAIYELCSEYPDDGVTCGPDLYDLIETDQHLFDGVHLNQFGNEIVFEALLPLLEIP